MKNIIITTIGMVCLNLMALAQETIYPAKENKEHFFIINGTIHIGNGQVFGNGTIEISNGKIIKVSKSITPPSGEKTIDAKGRQVYPGLILPITDLGLKEFGPFVRASNDYFEPGELNPTIRSIVAYNTDSKIINVLRSNGILLAGVSPKGALISGSSTVVQLDAWDWEEAVYKLDNAIHLYMPSLTLIVQNRFLNPGKSIMSSADQLKESIQKIEKIKRFFREAKKYNEQATHPVTNVKLQVVKGLFNGTQKLFVHATQVKQMLVAIDFVKDFGFDVVIAGGNESYLIADLLKQNNIAVILNQEHRLPDTDDEDVDQTYKTPFILQKAGVLFALNDESEENRYRNLSYNAGTASTYGLTKEQALQAITLNTARILGIDKSTGSIEEGKDANIIISEGDIMEMKTSKVVNAFINGKAINLDNKQKQLYERYKYKLGINHAY